MTVFELNTEGHFCKRCEQYRVRSVGGLCPVCADEDRRAEQDVPKPREAS